MIPEPVIDAIRYAAIREFLAEEIKTMITQMEEYPNYESQPSMKVWYGQLYGELTVWSEYGILKVLSMHGWSYPNNRMQFADSEEIGEQPDLRINWSVAPMQILAQVLEAFSFEAKVRGGQITTDRCLYCNNNIDTMEPTASEGLNVANRKSLGWGYDVLTTDYRNYDGSIGKEIVCYDCKHMSNGALLDISQLQYELTKVQNIPIEYEVLKNSMLKGKPQ